MMNRTVRLALGCSVSFGAIALAVPAAAQDGTSATAPQQINPDSAQALAPTADIVVTGVRGAQEAAIENKRTAAQIIDSIAAEDIGKLPDTTIADSLQRVPGVEISRSAGEGSAVNIRGLKYVLTMLDGELFLGGQNITTAQPNYADIPPTLFSGVDVVKSPTASDLEGGVSGSISLKTRRPLDLPRGLTLTGNTEESYGDRTDHFNQLVSGLASYNFNDRFGVLVSGSYSDSTLENENSTAGGFRKDVNAAIMPADRTYYYHVQDLLSSNNVTQRQRIGASLSLQYQATDDLKLTGDIFYTKFRNRDVGVGYDLINTVDDPAHLPGTIVDENGVEQFINYQLVRATSHTSNYLTRTQALNTNLQADFDNGGPFTATVRWVHGTATSHYLGAAADSQPTINGYVPRGAPGDCTTTPMSPSCEANNANGYQYIYATADLRGKVPNLNFITDIGNPNNYQLQSTWADGNNQRGSDDVFRVDAKYDVDRSFLSALKAGVRFSRRYSRLDNVRILSPIGGTDDDHLYFFKDPLIEQSGLDYSIVPKYPFSSIPDMVYFAKNFAPTKGFPAGGVPAINPVAMNDPLAYMNALYPGSAIYHDPTGSFHVNEDVWSAYLQADLQGRLIVPFTGNIGVRYVNNDLHIYGDQVASDQFIGNGGAFNGVARLASIEYTLNQSHDWLPSANLNFHLRPDMYFRLAFAKTIGRLDLGQLGTGLSALYYVNGDATWNGQHLPASLLRFGGGSGGNPNLKLPHSTNYNASYEWYFDRHSVFSLAAFLFDIDSFIEQQNSIEPQPDSDGVIRDGGYVTRYVNGSGGTVKGVEANIQTTFDYLPGFLSGFGAQLNYTFSDSGSANKDLFGKTFPVPDNSKHQANAILFYQKYGLQARVAYNYRSRTFVSVQNVDGDSLCQYLKPTGYLDASVSYDVTPRFTVYVQGTNLTGQNQYSYLQFPEQYAGANIFERRITFGVRFRN